MIGLGRVGHDWVMHGSNYDVLNVSTCSIITTEHSMCSLVMNLKAEYLFEIHIGQNCGINWGQGVYLAAEVEGHYP